MTNTTVGILHPGQMGISIAAPVQNGGHPVYWASSGAAPAAARAPSSMACATPARLPSCAPPAPS